MRAAVLLAESNLQNAIASKNILYYIAGVLITGGDAFSAALKSAELYVPSTGASCTLPSLPDDRYDHTVSHTISEGGLLCGGYYTEKSCIQWSPGSGTWEEALTLDVIRRGHVSWTPFPYTGTYLMGGSPNFKTTTLVKNDGTVEQGFPLKYEVQ